MGSLRHVIPVEKFMTVRIFFLILIAAVGVKAQTYKNLVFEGGGMRGVSYAGAIAVLEREGVLKGIEKTGGTSVGAITALTVALGYNAKEIENLISETNPRKFNDGTFLLFGGGTRLRKHYGWYKGKRVQKWIEKIIEGKTNNANITFQELHDQKYKDLYVTGTSLNNQKVLVFSYESYPTMRVKDAIRISMSIPFIFQTVFIDSVGHVLRKKQTKTQPYDVMVDGGFISNFPIDLFDTFNDNGKRIANSETLGFRIDTKAQVEQDKGSKGLAPTEITTLRNYIGAFFNFIMENLNRSNLTEEDWGRSISISAELVGPKVKKLSPAEKEKLISHGRIATEEYLKKHSH